MPDKSVPNVLQLEGPHDVMIAGHARSRGMCLVTNNEGEFVRVSRLRLANWTK